MCIYVYMYMYMYICMYMYVYAHICVYIYVYTSFIIQQTLPAPRSPPAPPAPHRTADSLGYCARMPASSACPSVAGGGGGRAGQTGAPVSALAASLVTASGCWPCAACGSVLC